MTASLFYSYPKNISKIRKKNKLPPTLKVYIGFCLSLDQRPKQITGRLKPENIISIHHETIYQHILTDKKDGGTLYKHLRHQKKTYRKRYKNCYNYTRLPNKVDIDKKPKITNNREGVGDFKTDTIIGKNHKRATAILDDRKTKLHLPMIKKLIW